MKPLSLMKSSVFLLTFAAALAAVSLVAIRGSAAQATDSKPGGPHFGVFSGHPRSGTVFTGVTVTFPTPDAYVIRRLLCKATLGGYLMPGPGGRRVVGGTVLQPIIHPYFEYKSSANGRPPGPTAITCGWRIPRRSAGKLLTLRPPRDRDLWGFAVVYRVYETDSRLGQPQAAIFYRGGTWRVRS
jgi:hypothetical protein